MISTPLAAPTRYHRQVLLPELGADGQARLAESSVLVVGAGGLGAPALTYLVAAGVGRISIVDFDDVEESNLHRQILFSTEDVGRPKTDAARDRLHALNPLVRLDVHERRFDAESAAGLLAGHDLVLDGTDTFATRYLVNDAAVLAGVPNVFASISRFDGQASVFGMPDGPCYRCLFPEPPPPGLIPNCAEGGVLGVLPGLLGTIQATEAIKLLARMGDPLVGRLLLVDALRMEFRTLTVEKDPACPVCGDHPTITSLTPMPALPEITPLALKALMDAGDRPFLLDVREANEYHAANLAGALIPLGQLPFRLHELEAHREEPFVVYCRSGARSAQAVRFLQENGFERATNLSGGIHAWSDQVDPSVPKV